MGKPSIILHNQTNGYGVTFTTDREIDREITVIFPLIPNKDSITLVSDEYLVDKITNEVTKQMDGRVAQMVVDELNKSFTSVIQPRLSEMIDDNNVLIEQKIQELDNKHTGNETEIKKLIDSNNKNIEKNKESISTEVTDRKEADRVLEEKLQDILDVFDPNANDAISGSITDLKTDIEKIRTVLTDVGKVTDANPNYDGSTVGVTYYPSNDFTTDRTLLETYNEGFYLINNDNRLKKDSEIILNNVVNTSDEMSVEHYYNRNKTLAYYLSSISWQLKHLGIAIIRNVPVGSILALPYDGRQHKEITNNYLLCDGSEITESIYPELYKKLSTDNKNSEMFTAGSRYDNFMRLSGMNLEYNDFHAAIAFYFYKVLKLEVMDTGIVSGYLKNFYIGMDDLIKIVNYFIPSSECTKGHIRSVFNFNPYYYLSTVTDDSYNIYTFNNAKNLELYWDDSNRLYCDNYSGSLSGTKTTTYIDVINNSTNNSNIYLLTFTNITNNTTLGDVIVFRNKGFSANKFTDQELSTIKTNLLEIGFNYLNTNSNLIKSFSFEAAKTVNLTIRSINFNFSYFTFKNNLIPFNNLVTSLETWLIKYNFFTGKTNLISVLYSDLEYMLTITDTRVNLDNFLLHCLKNEKYYSKIVYFPNDTRIKIKYEWSNLYISSDDNNDVKIADLDGTPFVYLVYLIKLGRNDGAISSPEYLFNLIKNGKKLKWSDTGSDNLCIYFSSNTSNLYGRDKLYFVYRGFGEIFMGANRTSTGSVNSEIYTTNDSDGKTGNENLLALTFVLREPSKLPIIDNKIKLPDLRDKYIKGTNEKPLIYKDWTIPRIYGKVKPDASRAWTYAAYGAPGKDGFVKPINQGATANASGYGSNMYIAGLDMDITYLDSYKGHTNDVGNFDVDHVTLQYWIKF